MFFRLLIESFVRQRRRKLLAGLAILLGTAAVTAMLAIGASVGDKINRELSTYGANLVVYPKADTLDVEVGGVSIRPASAGSYLNAADLPKLKGIFWRNNITDISPELPLQVELAHSGDTVDATVPAIGLWFHHELHFGGGSSVETYTMGAPAMHPWWKLQGAWPKEGAALQPVVEIVVGSELAAKNHWQIGDAITVNKTSAHIVGIVSTGDATERMIMLPLNFAQQLIGHPGAVRRVEVSALTKPEDALARRNPDSLSPKLRDRWYCSPYANSIAFQIEEALPNAHAEQIRQAAQGESIILKRISGLMWLVAIAALLSAGFAVAASMTTAILERKREIGLMRALGASRSTVANLFFAENALLALLSGALGYALGSLLANRDG